MSVFNFHRLLLSLFCVIMFSCASSVHQIEHPSQKPISIKKIVFARFFSDPDYLAQESEQVRVVKEHFLTDALYRELTTKVKGVNITSPETATSEIEKVRNENPALAYKDIVLRVGKNLDANAVLIGNISDYSERQGGEFGVESPASVVFEVQLLNVTNGEVIWEAYFNETQKTLLENVAEIRKFMKRRAKWITADELAKEGVVEVVDKLNKFLQQR